VLDRDRHGAFLWQHTRCYQKGTSMDDLDLEWCLARSAEGDQLAWGRLITRFTPCCGRWPGPPALRRRRLRRRCRDLAAAGGEPGSDPRARPGGAWLATTCRRECLAALRRAPGSSRWSRTGSSTSPVPTTAAWMPTCSGGSGTPGCGRSSRASVDPCRRLLRALLADPAPSYEEVSAGLGMPIGSIGPTRGRCLRTCTRSRSRQVSAATI
jgi:hypothetical protein